MPALHTARYKLPLLAVGQAQKELFHNEALSILDFLIQPVVISIEENPELLSPTEGQAWLIGNSPAGEWINHSNQIAGWTVGGWRFVNPSEHMRIFLENEQELVVFRSGTWEFAEQIDDPDGGSVVDTEARDAIESILQTLRSFGLVTI